MKRRVVEALVLLCLAGCTPGAAVLAPTAGTGGSAKIVDVNLTLHGATQTLAGTSGGYAPPSITVAVGTAIVFTNSDGFAHTATLIPNAMSFPAGTPFSSSAQAQSGSSASGGFSSGTLQAGQTSQRIVIDRAGTYLYGCFFHYGAPMRGTIVAQ